MPKKKDIINQKFGKLTVLEETQNRASNGSILWKCECECGNIIFSTGSVLKSGRRVSCGKCPRYENLIGQKFNLLTVIADTHTKTNNKEVWDFVNSIVPFNRYTNCPLANYKGELYNLPFNMNTFHQKCGSASANAVT